MKKHITTVLLSAAIFLMQLMPSFNLFPVSAAALTITKAGGWYETAYVEWSGGVPGSEQVYVKLASETDSAYTSVDGQLVRGARADIPGLIGGTDYDIRVTSGGESVWARITPMKSDRTGYAHWNRSDGVGAYNNDGTPKSGMSVIYVTDANKNSVSRGGQTGIFNILNNAAACSNLIVRFIGAVNVPNGVTVHDGKKDGANMVRIRGSNVTIEGIGYDANLVRWGFSVSTTNSVEIRNLHFAEQPEDAVEVAGDNNNKANRVWIHNNTFLKGKNEYAGNGVIDDDKKNGDGTTDVKRSEYVTISYNFYQQADKTSLVGGGTGDQQDWLTYHHNYFDRTGQRCPRARNAHIHMFNNYFNGVTSYAVGASHDSIIFTEGNAFENTKAALSAKKHGSDPNSGTIKSYNDTFDSKCTFEGMDKQAVIVPNRNDKPAIPNATSGGKAYDHFDLDSSKIYSYTPTTASEAKTEVLAYAGRMKNQDYNKGTIHNTPVQIPDLNGTLIKNLKRFDTVNYANWSIQNNVQIGNEIYGDRAFTFTSIPTQLTGLEWIRPACDSKNMQTNVAEFTAGKAISVFVSVDTRVSARPDWLSDWTNTGKTVASSNDLTYDIYKKDFSEGAKVTLGTNGDPAGVVMYTVFVARKDTISFEIPPLEGTLIKNLNRFDEENYQDWSIQNNPQIGGEIYGDREYTFTTVPSLLINTEWIRPACDSKNMQDDAAEFTAGADMTVFIGLDARVTANHTLPAWLSEWEKTDETFTVSNDVTYDIYKKYFAEGEKITLGSNGNPSGVSMYTVFAERIDSDYVPEYLYISKVNVDDGWVEVTNPTADAICCKGLYLSNNSDPYLWQMPGVIVRPDTTVRIKIRENSVNTDTVLKRMLTSFDIELGGTVNLTAASGEVLSSYQ